MTARRDGTWEPVRRDERDRSWAPAVEESERPAPLMIRDQTNFVDEPRQAVKDADELVEALMGRLVEIFKKERSILEEQWTRNEEVSTEDLRVVFQRYRSFFDRLLDIRAA